jgi:hypothetical protein
LLGALLPVLFAYGGFHYLNDLAAKCAIRSAPCRVRWAWAWLAWCCATCWSTSLIWPDSVMPVWPPALRRRRI